MTEFKNLYDASIKHLKDIENKLTELSTQLDQQKIDNELRLLVNADIKHLFNVSDKTITNWRNKGFLVSSKIAGTFYYNIADIKTLLEETKIIKKKG